MILRRATIAAACMAAFALGAAQAQMAPWPQQAAPQPAAPWPDPAPRQASPWPQQQQAPQQASPWTQQAPPCLQEFSKLRDETEKRGLAIKHASERRAPPKEACQLLIAFTGAEAKMLKYALDNQAACGIPPQIITSIKQGHAKSDELRVKVCRVAAEQPAQRGPTLSDALSAPVTSSRNIRTGRGTFDTLTGAPLGK
ncbi:MAG TPA: hypothetical protein VG986_20900 [Pseudolabrys sp.]|nr:hypothetical protein [Pseudolabrys sp.]